MGHVEATTNLTAAPEKVWTLIADPQTWEQWFKVHAGWPEPPPATLSTGTKLVEKIAILGMADKLEWNVTAYEKPRNLTLDGTSKTGIKVTFSFVVEPTATGSAFSVIGNFEGAAIKGLLGKTVERMIGKQFDESVMQLDALAAA